MAFYESLSLLLFLFFFNTVYLILKMEAFVNIKIRPIYQEIVQTVLPIYGFVFKQACIVVCLVLMWVPLISITKEKSSWILTGCIGITHAISSLTWRECRAYTLRTLG